MNLSATIIKYQLFVVLLAVVIFLGILYIFIPGDTSYWFEYWWMFPIAFLIALTVNTAGISGAALFVPFFILVFPLFSGTQLSPIESVKLGLITESFGISSSALAFLAFGLVDLTLARRLFIRALPFVIGGVFLVFLIPKSVLYLMIAALLIISVFLLRFEHKLKKKRINENQSNNIDISLEDEEKVSITSKDSKVYKYCRTKSGDKKRFIGYGLGGVFQGAAGFGIGEIGIISMMLTRIPTRIAIGTSHFIIAGTAIVASIAHLLLASSFTQDVFPWNIVAMTVPAVIIGGQLAPHVAAKLSTNYLEKFVSSLFIIISIALMVVVISTF